MNHKNNNNLLTRISRVVLIIALSVAAFNLGAGSAVSPSGDELKLVSHGVPLSVGSNLPLPESLPVISTDYHNHFPNPRSFEHSKDIMTKGLLPKNRLVSFLWLNNQRLSLEEVEQIVTLYIKESAIEGVNHDIAFIQMCLETGYLKFGGDVSRHQNNFCGLGAIGGGVPGLTFSTVEEGIRAHIQHLKAYASHDSLKTELVDARFGVVKRGSAQNIHDLTGRWAVDPNYGKKIDKLLATIYAGAHIQRNRTSILFD
jgi:hypothetical protein